MGTSLVNNVARVSVPGGKVFPLAPAGVSFNGIIGDVSALGVDGSGAVVAGGNFRGTGAGLARNLVRFDGTRWQELGGRADQVELAAERREIVLTPAAIGGT